MGAVRLNPQPVAMGGIADSVEVSMSTSDKVLNVVVDTQDGQRIIAFNDRGINYFKRSGGTTTLLWSK